MLSFVAQRIVKGAIVLLAIIVLNFFLIRLAPGDPAVVMDGEAGAGDQIFVTQLREKFGLDRPLPEQLFLYVKGIVSFDLGFSFRQQMPVSKLIMDRLAGTLVADDDRVRDLARARHSPRYIGGTLGRNLGGYRDHGGGAGVLCHAAVLDRADGDPAVLSGFGLAAEFRLRDHRR